MSLSSESRDTHTPSPEYFFVPQKYEIGLEKNMFKKDKMQK